MPSRFTISRRFSAKPSKDTDSTFRNIVQDPMILNPSVPNAGRSPRSPTKPYVSPRSSRSSRSSGSSSSAPARCHFMNLPKEIRLYIYTIVYSEERLELIQSGARKAALRRSSKEPAYLLSLPLTCRRIHQEATPILYTAPKFVLDDPATLPLLPPPLLSSMRHLTLEWGYQSRPKDFPEGVPIPWRSIYPAPLDDRRWERFWYLVAARMQGLQNMTLVLGLMGTTELGRDWVKPVLRVRGLKKFRMQMWFDDLSWITDNGLIEGGLRRVPRDVEKKWEEGIGGVVCSRRDFETLSLSPR